MTQYPRRPTVLLSGELGDSLLNGFIEECNNLGWRAINLVSTSNYIPSGQPPIGAIIARPPPPPRTLTRLRELAIPIVRLTPVELIDGPGVFEDRRGAAQLAANAFVERGFKNLAYIDFTTELTTNPIYWGFKRQAEDVHGCKLHLCRLRKGRITEDQAIKFERHVERIAAWLKDLPTPLGILAFNYRMGLRITAACEMAGLSVPEQVAIICRGNRPAYCDTAPVPLSAVDMNPEEQGREAVRLLKRLVDGAPVQDEPIYIPPKGIVERRSTDILAVPDPKVAAAIRFMWDHLDWPLGVDDIAFEVKTSRNTLERAFRRNLGRGVNGELRRKRMEVCKELLRSTNMTIAEIAKAIGITNRRHLHRAFKEASGITPRQYRIDAGSAQVESPSTPT